MTDREQLLQRIELTIAKHTFSKAAAAILEEIERTHVLLPRDGALDAAVLDYASDAIWQIPDVGLRVHMLDKLQVMRDLVNELAGATE